MKIFFNYFINIFISPVDKGNGFLQIKIQLFDQYHHFISL
jgi:hypothetical protein